MKGAVPLKIKLRFVAHDDRSKCEVSEAGIKCHLDLTLKVPLTLQDQKLFPNVNNSLRLLKLTKNLSQKSYSDVVFLNLPPPP